MNINHISVSRSQVWDLCQLKYKFQYHLKIPSPFPEPPYFLYGKLVHKIAEEYVKNKGKKNINDIRTEVLNGDILLEENATEAPNKVLPKTYLNKLPGHIRAFMRLTNKIGTDGICEYRFHYDLDPPHKKFVHGFIDRIIQKDDQFFILDYKTTKKGPWRRNKRDIVADLQLQCYARIVMKEFGAKAENIKAALFYLEGEELLGATFTEKTLMAVEKYLLNIYNLIKNTDPDKAKGRVGRHCERCDYRSMCPLYSLT